MPARVWFAKAAQERAHRESYATLVAETQRDGGTEFSLFTYSLEWMARWLLSFGTNAEAVERRAAQGGGADGLDRGLGHGREEVEQLAIPRPLRRGKTKDTGPLREHRVEVLAARLLEQALARRALAPEQAAASVSSLSARATAVLTGAPGSSSPCPCGL